MSKISIGTPSGVEKRDMTAEEEAQRTIDAEKFEQEKTERQAQIDLKASAKAKLIAGEALTEDEANTIVL